MSVPSPHGKVVVVSFWVTWQAYVRTVRALYPRLPGLLMTRDRDGTLGKPCGTDKGILIRVMLHRDGTWPTCTRAAAKTCWTAWSPRSTH